MSRDSCLRLHRFPTRRPFSVGYDFRAMFSSRLKSQDSTLVIPSQHPNRRSRNLDRLFGFDIHFEGHRHAFANVAIGDAFAVEWSEET